MGFYGRFLVGGHGFAVEMFYFEHIDGDAAAVSSACPLGVLYFVRDILRKMEFGSGRELTRRRVSS